MRVVKGCPLCQGDVLGTLGTGFYCKQCNVIFSKHHIVFKHARKAVRQQIRKHFSGFEKMTFKPARIKEPRIPLPKKRPDASFLDAISERIKENVEHLQLLRPDLDEAARQAVALEQMRKPKTLSEDAKKSEQKVTKSSKKSVKRKPKSTTAAKKGTKVVKVVKKSAPKSVKAPKKAIKKAVKKRVAKKAPAKKRTVKKATKKKAGTPQGPGKGLENLL